MYFGLDIILVKLLSKHTLNTYFSGMKIDPEYVFLYAFFLICPICPFQNLSIWPTTHPFFSILHIFAPLNNVREYIAWSWKTTLIMWIFLRGWYPTSNTSGLPRHIVYLMWTNIFLTNLTILTSQLIQTHHKINFKWLYISMSTILPSLQRYDWITSQTNRQDKCKNTHFYFQFN